MERNATKSITSVMRTMTWVVLLGSVGLYSSAQGYGNISGAVIDSSGAAIPGANVTLAAAQGGVGGHQERATDSQGVYQFLLLAPGTYNVSATKQGFATIEQTGVLVVADSTARADLRMGVAALNQTVTVSTAPPSVDTDNANIQTVIPEEELNVLPNRTDLWSMSKIVPGLVYGNIDVGGDQRYFQAIPTARGVSTQTAFFVDGMPTGSMNAVGSTAIIYPDPYSFSENNVQLDAGSAEYSNGGITFSMVTKSGTNQFHGGVYFNGTTPALSRSRNYSPTLYAELLSAAPAAAKAANPNLQPNADIRLMLDAGAHASGHILRDRLWYAGSWRYQILNQFTFGNYEANGQEVEDNDEIWTTGGKVSWQALTNTQVSYFNNLQYHLQGHRATGSGFFSGAATERNPKYPIVNQIKVTSVFKQNIVTDFMYSRMRTDDDFYPQPGVGAGSVATDDTATTTLGVAQSTYNINQHHRDNARAAVSWLLGKNTVEFGSMYQWNSVGTPLWSTSGMEAVFNAGVPTSVIEYVVAVTKDPSGLSGGLGPEYKYVEHVANAYIQDKYRATRRLVVNLGLNVESEGEDVTPLCEPTNQFYSAKTCFGAVIAPKFLNFSPRFGVIYDIRGNGNMVIKGSLNRYVQPLGSSTAATLNPLAGGSDAGLATVVSQTVPWNCTGACIAADGPAPTIAELTSQLGTAPGFVFTGQNASYALGTTRPADNEYTAEFDQRLPKDLVLTVRFVQNETRHNFDYSNAALAPSAWTESSVTETNCAKAMPGSPLCTVNVWNRPAASAGGTAFQAINVNDPSLNLVYKGVDILINKRMTEKWFVTGGASFASTQVNSKGGNRSDPNVINNAFQAGKATSDEPWSLRGSGTYQLPYKVLFSGTALYQIGAPESTTVSVTSATVKLNQGTQSVPIASVGTIHLPDIFDLDMNLQRPFKVAHSEKMTWVPRIEMFNATNRASIQTWGQVLGPTYHIPTAIQRGRLIKGQIDFNF